MILEKDITRINHRNILQRILFLFLVTYFFIYAFPFPLGYIQLTKILNNWYNHVFDLIVSYAGKHVFHIPFALVATSNGSGDTTYNYVRLFLVALFAIIVTIVWCFAESKGKSYDRVLYWIIMYLRFYLALIMMRYGLEKIIKTQFPFPYYSLNETYGTSTPMRLLWTFMGYSKAFNVFTGLIEIIGGVLLLFKKTTTFGLLVCITVLTNIAVINFCFDVPVKLFAVNLLLLAIFILLPDAKRVIDFFFKNKAVPAADVQLTFTQQWKKPVWVVIKFAIIISVAYSITMFVWRKYNTSGDAAFKKTPLFGIYTVEKFIMNNDTTQTQPASATRWKTLNIIFPKHAEIDMADTTVKAYNFITDTLNKTIALYENDDSANKSVLTYFMQDSAHLILSGKLKDDSVYMQLRKQNLNEFPLLNRKFHWISEAPYNK
jgi:hypothetical protein